MHVLLAGLQPLWPSRGIVPHASALHMSALPSIGQELSTSDVRSFGPWWHPATHGRRLRELFNVVCHPLSEAGYAWHSVQSSNVVVFAERSMHGNGDVMITSCGPWRCLTFDGVEQGVAYVGDGGDTGVLGLEYLRVMAAAALGFGVSCRRLVDKTR